MKPLVVLLSDGRSNVPPADLCDGDDPWQHTLAAAARLAARKVSEERFSFPLFFSCDYDVQVEPLPQFVSPERPARYPSVKAGEHLYAQTLQSFTYLKQRLAKGELQLPDGARPLSSFGQEGKVIHERSVG
jgi:hypothetical protein